MAKVGRTRFGAKSKASTAKTYDKVEGELAKIIEAIKDGAIVEEKKYWNKTEYWIVYPQGGAHRISLRIYNKIK